MDCVECLQLLWTQFGRHALEYEDCKDRMFMDNGSAPIR